MAAIRLKPESKELLLSIAAGEGNPVVIADTDTAPMKELVKNKLVLFGAKTAEGATPVVLSEGGKEKAATYKPAGTGTPRGPLPDPDSFVIEDNVPIPEFKRGGAARQVYPFEKLSKGQSFFIAPTGNSDNPAKSKQSTVTAQNKRALTAWEASDPTTRPAEAPKWKIGPDTKDGVKGARVWRVA